MGDSQSRQREGLEGPKGGWKHPGHAIVTHAGAGGGEARSSGRLREVTQFPHTDTGGQAGGSGGSGGDGGGGGRWAGSGRLQRLPVSAGSGWHCAAQRGGQSLFLHLPRASAREKISMATLLVPPSLFHGGQGALPLPAPTQLGCPHGGDRPLVPWEMGSGKGRLCCRPAPCHGSLLIPPRGAPGLRPPVMGSEIWDSPNLGGSSPLCSQFQRRQVVSHLPDTSLQDTPNLRVPQLELRPLPFPKGKGGILGEVK